MHILDLSSWLSASIVFLSILFLVIVPYLIARYFLRSHSGEDTENLASSIIFRTASLHSLILALVFAQEQVNVFEIRKATVEEGSAVADIFYDLKRYDPVSTVPLQGQLAEYTKVVIEEEWDLLNDGKLSSKAWELWDHVYNGILDLEPGNIRQETLRGKMLADIGKISKTRDLRQADYYSGITPLFWLIAILGVVFVVLPYFVFRVNKVNLLLIGTYAAFTALVIYTIIAMSTPYRAPILVEPTGLVEVFTQDMIDLVEQ